MATTDDVVVGNHSSLRWINGGEIESVAHDAVNHVVVHHEIELIGTASVVKLDCATGLTIAYRVPAKLDVINAMGAWSTGYTTQKGA